MSKKGKTEDKKEKKHDKKTTTTKIRIKRKRKWVMRQKGEGKIITKGEERNSPRRKKEEKMRKKSARKRRRKKLKRGIRRSWEKGQHESERQAGQFLQSARRGGETDIKFLKVVLQRMKTMLMYS